jgi:hypothetical protein
MKNLVGHPGFEPGTSRLKGDYSTVELVTLTFFESPLPGTSLVNMTWILSLVVADGVEPFLSETTVLQTAATTLSLRPP